MPFFAALSLHAATIPGSFQQIDCEGGGWLEQIIPHSSGRLYARTDVGGLYRSDDHGDTWQFISGDMDSARFRTLRKRCADTIAGPWTDLARSTGGAAFVALNGNVTANETGTGAIRSVEVRDRFTFGDPAHPRRFLRVAFTSP